MGNDGGSIPTRRELVKEAARNPTTTQIKETRQEQLEYYWTTCPLSRRPLSPPVVSDSSGNLYNKDAVLEFLLPSGDGTPGLSKSDNEEVLGGRVRSLRDVVEVKFHVEQESRSSPEALKWVCPITNKALGRGVKAVYLVPCGHAFLESAVREMPDEICSQCNEAYMPDNVITILPTSSADKERLVSRVQKLKDQGLTHSLKKTSSSGKKRKKIGNPNTLDTQKAEQPTAVAKDLTTISNTQSGSGAVTPSGGIKNTATASLTAKVLAEEHEKSKRRKMGTNDNLKSLFSSDDRAPKKDGDFMTRGFSIPAGARH